MTHYKLIISDLHLADNTFPLDGFGQRQQEAFMRFLSAFAAEPSILEDTASLELIINGDCFDFLMVSPSLSANTSTSPYSTIRSTDATFAQQKLEKIRNAHPSFFTELRRFLAFSHHSLTFLAGNHDIELCFPEVQQRICEAITGKPSDERVRFVPDRFYFPAPDVVIEHGHAFDAWNCPPELWDDAGRLRAPFPAHLELPPGTIFHQQVLRYIALKHPYIEHLEPPISNIREIALLCLIDPELLHDMVQRTVRLFAPERSMTMEANPDPQKLFDAVIFEFLAFRSEMGAQREEQRVSQAEMLEYMQVREALALPVEQALARLFTSSHDETSAAVSQGMHEGLRSRPELRYAIAGHTHSWRRERLSDTQTYLNTGTWVDRYAMPSPEEITPELIAWLRQTDWRRIPLRDLTLFSFVLVATDPGTPSQAYLYAWDMEHNRYEMLE